MSYTQLITPNPNVACIPGECLKYVQDTFGLKAVYPTAMAAWNASQHKHQDKNFPSGVDVAVWFSLANNPAGHVALLRLDGSVYSSSDPNSNTPHHHPSLAALIQYYAKANPLTYLGWTEDVEGTLVIKEEDMLTKEQITVIYDLAFDTEDSQVNQDVVKAFTGKSVDELLTFLHQDASWQAHKARVNLHVDTSATDKLEKIKTIIG